MASSYALSVGNRPPQDNRLIIGKPLGGFVFWRGLCLLRVTYEKNPHLRAAERDAYQLCNGDDSTG